MGKNLFKEKAFVVNNTTKEKTMLTKNISAGMLAVCAAYLLVGCGDRHPDPVKVEAEFAQLVNSVVNNRGTDNEFDSCVRFVKPALAYADNGQLAYVNDENNLREFAKILMALKDAHEYVKTARPRTVEEQKASDFYRRLDIKKIDAILEMLKEKSAQIRAVFQTWASHGRSLFVAIIQAETDRWSQGFASVYPQTANSVSDNKEDISGRVFANATDYFCELFDMQNKDKGGAWEPYIDSDPNFAFVDGKSMWNVAAGLKDEMSDVVPVLISANFDCKNLPTKSYDGKTNANVVIPIGTCPLLGNNGIVVVHKGGAVNYIPAHMVTLGVIYNKQPVSELPEYYLAP